jgi:hypothetical protein
MAAIIHHISTQNRAAQSFQETYRLLGATKHKLVNKSKKKKGFLVYKRFNRKFPSLFLCPKRKNPGFSRPNI